MLIFPAIDLYDKKAVRLYKGDFSRMTVYSDDPPAVAAAVAGCGATHIHVVDLEGARDGGTANYEVFRAIKDASGAFCEIGGGVRSREVIERYLSAGADRVILGTTAVADPAFLEAAVGEYGPKIAVGVDIRDGKVAIKGWTESSELDAYGFCEKMRDTGVSTLICTDISRDGAMRGANVSLYRGLSDSLSLDIIASGGVSSLEDIRTLASMGLYGAIVGKAYYTGAVDLREAIEVAK